MCFSCDNTISPLFSPAPPENPADNSWIPAGTNKKARKPAFLTPRPYRILENICAVSACIHRNAAIDRDHILWCWGADSIAYKCGAFSNDFPQNPQRTPQRVMEQVLSVCCGGWHTLCITHDKKLWAWGENEYGQLGLGDTKKRVTPTFVMDGVESVCANEYQSFAIREDHTLWGWGSNESGTLFDSFKTLCTPKLLMENVIRISCGSSTAAALRPDGTLWAWGRNANNIIFTKPRYHFYQPVLLMAGVTDMSFSASECSEYGLAIAENGDLYCLGDLTYQSQRTAILRKEQKNMPLKLINNISAAYAGNGFMLAKDAYGRLFALGRNELGQCGTGTSTGVIRKPALIMAHAKQAASGYFHGMGLQENGDLWIWGGDYGLNLA